MKRVLWPALGLGLCLALAACSSGGDDGLKSACEKMADCGWIAANRVDACVKDGEAGLSSAEQSCVASCPSGGECYTYLDCLVGCNGR